ncbi:MAG: hypothetical protein M3509_05345 [Chloroflexota bacterium]|nr:hypothetical protein [Chloroflexota bacterium]
MISYDEEGELLGLVAACDRGLAATLDAQRDLPESERLTARERQRLLDAIVLVWETDLEAGSYDVANEGPEAIGRGATPDEQREIGLQVRQMIAPAAGDAVTHQTRNRAAIWILAQLGGGAGLSDEDLLAEYRNAELWPEAADTLLRLDRVEEALGLAARRLTVAFVLTRFADRLIATGDPIRIDQALTLVDGCLWEREGREPHQDHALSAWLEGQHADHGRPDRALELARRRFQNAPSRQTYEAVQTAALLPDQPGAPWPDLRPTLLATLSKRGDWFGLIDIHLAADEVAEAIAALPRTERKGRNGAIFGYSWSSATRRGWPPRPSRISPTRRSGSTSGWPTTRSKPGSAPTTTRRPSTWPASSRCWKRPAGPRNGRS